MKMDGLIIVYNILCAVSNFIIDHFKRILRVWKKGIQCITISSLTEQI